MKKLKIDNSENWTKLKIGIIGKIENWTKLKNEDFSK